MVKNYTPTNQKNIVLQKKNKNASKKKDFPRILVAQLRKRIKQGIKKQGIPKTIKINKVKKGHLKLQNYQFIQIFLNIKPSRLGY